MANPLAARRSEPETHYHDKQARCDDLNGRRLTVMMDQFYFVRRFDDGTEKIECMDLPAGTKGWIRENGPRVKGLIRKITGGEQWLIDQIYQRSIDAAPVPKAWSNRANRPC